MNKLKGIVIPGLTLALLAHAGFVQAANFWDYDRTYREVNEGHDWGNWKPLFDDVLVTFFAAD